MQAFLDQLAVVHPYLPIFARALVLIVAVIVAWLVLSLPAHWLWRALDPLFDRLSGVLDGVQKRLFALCVALFGHRNGAVQAFVKEHAQSYSFADENAELGQRLSRLLGAVERLPRDGKDLERTLDAAAGTINQTGLTIQRVTWPQPVEPPSPQQYAAIVVEDNDARLRTVVFGFLTIVLVSINTLMLKEFFSVLFPPIRIVGIPLAILGSFAFSLFEMGIGAVLAFTDTKPGSVPFTRFGVVLVLLVLGGIEWTFYAQFGAELDLNPFAVFYAPDQPPIWTKSWFGAFGPAVVLIMGLVGERFVRAVRHIVRNSVVKQYRRFLDHRTKAGDAINARIEESKRASATLLDRLVELSGASKPAAEAMMAAFKSIEGAKTELRDILTAEVNARRQPFGEVPTSEMLRTHFTSLYYAASALVAALIIGVAFGVFGLTLPRFVSLIALPAPLIAMAEVVLLIGAGYATSRVAVALFDATGNKSLVQSRVLTGCAYAVVLVVVGANAVLFLWQPSVIDVFWFVFTTAAAIWLAVVGRRLGVMIASVWTLIKGLIAVFAAALVFIAAALLLVVRVVVEIVRALLRVVRYPVTLVTRERGPANVARAAIATAILLALFAMPHPARALEPQSSVTVLIDLSATWLNPASARDNERVLTAVGEAVTQLASEVDPPLVVRYLPIGDLSLGREPLCEVVFTPHIVQGNRATAMTSLKKLREYLNGACLTYVLARKQEPFTDITSALDSAGRTLETQTGKFKGLVVLSDFKEERRPQQKSGGYRLDGANALLLYRVLPEDRPNVRELDSRIDAWRTALETSGAKAVKVYDMTVTAGVIARMLTP